MNTWTERWAGLSTKLSANHIPPQVEMVGGKEEEEREVVQKSYHFSYILSSGAV